MKDKLKKWNLYFRNKLKQGYSWNDIRLELIFYHKYKVDLVEALIKNFREGIRRQTSRRFMVKISIASLILVFCICSIFFQRMGVTGKAIGQPGDIFYVDSVAGSDLNDGLSPDHAVKTIDKVNTLPVDPGDKVLFKRGGVWRCPTDAYLSLNNGNSNYYTYYGAYGSGDKPLFLGSLNLSLASAWTSIGGNIWATTSIITEDVGSIAFQDGSFAIRNWSIAEISASGQGHFFYDDASQILYLYSTSNPATFYGQMEVMIKGDSGKSVIYVNSRHNVIIENISIKYGAREGIIIDQGNDIIIRNIDISYIGGGVQEGADPLRLGNGIEVWQENHNITVEGCRIWEIFDAPLTYQGYGPGDYSASNIIFRNNVMWDSEYCFEFSNQDIESIVENVVFDHNTCHNMGDSWATPQRYDSSGQYGICLRNAKCKGTCTGINFTNNICFEATKYVLQTSSIWTDWSSNSNLYIDYNLYWRNLSTGLSSNYLLWSPIGKAYSALSSYQSDTGKDIHSMIGSPQFVDSSSRDYRPQEGSIACTMSSTGNNIGALSCSGTPPPVNIPPNHSNPILQTSDYPINSSNATLNCYNQSTADADGDLVTNSYRWFRNSSLVSGQTASSVSASLTSIGDSWKCEVKPYDGADYGTALNSSVLVIRSICGDSVCYSGEDCSSCSQDCGQCNAVPTQSAPILNASDYPVNSTNATLRCYNRSTADADGDSVTNSYRWFRSSSLVSGQTASSVSASLTSIGDSWKCEVKPFDGHSYGAALNSSALIVRSVCGDSICYSGENCSSCQNDCGACPAPNNNISACSLEDKSWNVDESYTVAFNLSSCFIDPMGQQLSYSAIGNSSVIVWFNQDGSVDLSAPANWIGSEYVIFKANDSIRYAQTNNVTLTVQPLAVCGDAVCDSGESCSSCDADCGACKSSSGGGGGGGGSSTTDSDWICGDWSDCNGGKQTQLCRHATSSAERTNSQACSSLPVVQQPTNGASHSGFMPNPEENKIASIVTNKKESSDDENISPEEDAVVKPALESPGQVVLLSSMSPTLISGVVAFIILSIFVAFQILIPKKERSADLDIYAKNAPKRDHSRLQQKGTDRTDCNNSQQESSEK
jgi:hypothetical protein